MLRKAPESARPYAREEGRRKGGARDREEAGEMKTHPNFSASTIALPREEPLGV
jgi:hypothetical protein